MSYLKLFGAALIILSGIVFLRSYRKYEKERIAAATSLLALLRRAAEEALTLLTPIKEIVLKVEDEVLLARGFVTEYSESLSLSAAFDKVAGRYRGRIFSLLSEGFSSLQGKLSCNRGDSLFSECEKMRAELELEKEMTEKNIKVTATLTVAVVLGLIILFL